jgi:uncharacterized protein
MQDKQAQPWWKFGHVWMVIAGPAIVVVAGFITLYLAIRTPDPVISHETQRRAGDIVQPEGASPGLAPAIQARNHAATGVVTPVKP